MESLMKWFLPGVVMLATSLLPVSNASALTLRPMSLQVAQDGVKADPVRSRGGRTFRIPRGGGGRSFSGGGPKFYGGRGGNFSAGQFRGGKSYSGTFRGYQKPRYSGGQLARSGSRFYGGKQYNGKSGSYGGYKKRRYSGNQLAFNGGRYSGGKHYDRKYSGHGKHYSRYDRHRHGKRSHYRHDKYRYYYDGYWYLFPWWLGTVTYLDNYPYYDEYYAPGDPHVEWCLRRYRSYNPETDMYLGYDGLYHRCISPYSPLDR